MSLNAYDLSAGLFVRGLSNLKAQLKKAEEQTAASGRSEAALLNTKLAEGDAPADLHTYTLSAQVHWAAEGARLAISQLLGESAVRAASDAKSLADLHHRLDATIAQLRKIAPGDLEAGLARTIVIEHPRGSTRAAGSQFLVAFAIPHFFYHLTCAYSILRNQGVQLRMGDFLGNWGAA